MRGIYRVHFTLIRLFTTEMWHLSTQNPPPPVVQRYPILLTPETCSETLRIYEM
jgi:hypothetical protein